MWNLWARVRGRTTLPYNKLLSGDIKGAIIAHGRDGVGMGWGVGWPMKLTLSRNVLMRLQSFKCAPPRYLLHGPALMDNDIDSNTYHWIYDV